LYKPHVKDYFRTEKGIKTNIKIIIIVGIVILLILNGYIAMLNNPLLDHEIGKIPDERYYGTWENESENIEITFYSNSSFFISKKNDTYWGTWENYMEPLWDLKLNWEEGEGIYAPLFIDKNNVKFVQKKGESGYFSVIDLKKKL